MKVPAPRLEVMMPIACSVRSPDRSDGRLTRTLGISLLGAPPGEYALDLTVKDERSGQTLSRTEAFTVAP